MKYLALFLPLLLLGACTEEERQKQKVFIESQLPDGCTFQYLGEYSGMKVAVVHCENHFATTTSLHYSLQSGKTRSYRDDITVEVQ